MRSLYQRLRFAGHETTTNRLHHPAEAALLRADPRCSTALSRRQGDGTLEPTASENKYYVADVGNVLTVDLVTGERSELTQITSDTP